MKIERLEINNFKAIKSLTLASLGSVVVIAGPNGAGKSCVLDAIRFLKACYGGNRHQNEWQMFFGEFNLDTTSAAELHRLFLNIDKSIKISAQFSLTNKEIEYLKRHGEEKIRELLIGVPGAIAGPNAGVAHADSEAMAQARAKLENSIQQYSLELSETLKRDLHNAEVVLTPRLEINTSPNIVLSLIFGIYEPANIGIIDYHSAHRTYQRERIGGINVNIKEASERVAQHALFNWHEKYTHIKSELAAAFIRDLLVEKAGGPGSKVPSIVATMEELFQIFLPGKTFAGPRPGLSGELSFPVELIGGGSHDIDDLSSGEKELVYGYLRIRNVAPENSIILLDEPELHLNPQLILGLPAFYRKHLGSDLGNQLWMTTHSDAFLRDAYKEGGFSIFHISPALTAPENGNQCVPIKADSEVDQAIISLVGDISAFRPGNRIVVFESSENAAFDAYLTLRLFPELKERITPISGDNKVGVRQLYSALTKAISQMRLAVEVSAIVDRDADRLNRPEKARVFCWDVYHIENYLLDPKFIAKVMLDNPSYAEALTEVEIDERLRACAEQSLAGLVAYRLREHINALLLRCLDLGYDPGLQPGIGLDMAVKRAQKNINFAVEFEVSGEKIASKENEETNALKRALEDGSWRSEFRGRDILRRFAGKYLPGLPYEAFRDGIIARMADAGFRPVGMAKVIENITERT